MNDPIAVMNNVVSGYGNAAKWRKAPLGDVKLLSNTHVGNAGQDFIREWCQAEGISWKDAPSKQSSWDAEIDGKRYEIKTATEDTNDNFQFNHIRHHRDYDGVLCLGIAPNAILFGIWTKAEIATGKAGNLVTMDKGSSATFKLTKKKADLLPIKQFKQTIQAAGESGNE